MQNTFLTISKADSWYRKSLQHPLVHVEEATHLGATFDKRMSWKSHLANAGTKARKKLAVLCKLTVLCKFLWRARENILKYVYLDIMRIVLESDDKCKKQSTEARESPESDS